MRSSFALTLCPSIRSILQCVLVTAAQHLNDFYLSFWVAILVEMCSSWSFGSVFKCRPRSFGALHPTASRGTYTDYEILSEYDLTQKPKSITHEEALAIPFAALTAWRALKRTARINEGQRLLVIGGGGAAVGYIEDIELAIKGAFDAILDTIGGQKTKKIGINFLKRGGRYMTLQGDARSMVLDAVGFHAYSKVFLRKKFLYSYYYGIGYYYAFMEPDCLGLREICRLSEAGRFHIYVLIKHSQSHK
ncbi:hypothetical protein NL676_024081 [Syzygium grande]|nr:hypothetical protein NL676_024081 [Syzygium grande]